MMILKHTNWYKKFLFLLGMVLSLKLMAIPPGEVVDACIESIAIDYGMTFTEIAHPTGKEEELCEGDQFLIVNVTWIWILFLKTSIMGDQSAVVLPQYLLMVIIYL
nr:hypothetical protein [Legionella pneumophila]